jgi:hypothetical protein
MTGEVAKTLHQARNKLPIKGIGIIYLRNPLNLRAIFFAQIQKITQMATQFFAQSTQRKMLFFLRFFI